MSVLWDGAVPSSEFTVTHNLQVLFDNQYIEANYIFQDTAGEKLLLLYFLPAEWAQYILSPYLTGKCFPFLKPILQGKGRNLSHLTCWISEHLKFETLSGYRTEGDPAPSIILLRPFTLHFNSFEFICQKRERTVIDLLSHLFWIFVQVVYFYMPVDFCTYIEKFSLLGSTRPMHILNKYIQGWVVWTVRTFWTHNVGGPLLERYRIRPWNLCCQEKASGMYAICMYECLSGKQS